MLKYTLANINRQIVSLLFNGEIDKDEDFMSEKTETLITNEVKMHEKEINTYVESCMNENEISIISRGLKGYFDDERERNAQVYAKTEKDYNEKIKGNNYYIGIDGSNDSLGRKIVNIVLGLIDNNESEFIPILIKCNVITRDATKFEGIFLDFV